MNILKRFRTSLVVLGLGLAAVGCGTETGGEGGIGSGEGGSGGALYCTGAEGDRAVAADNSVGVSLPANRTCLNATLTEFLQGAKGNTQPAAMSKDGKGNVYVTGLTKGFLETTYGDLFIAKFAPNGVLTWLKTYGTPKKDVFPLTGVHDPSVGVEGMLAIDKDGSIFAVGNYDANHGVIVKLDTDGKALWSKGVAKQAFQAVSVAKGVVHIAGDMGIYALDAATGKNLGQLGFSIKGYKSRMFAIKATEAGDIYLGGWGGFKGDDDAVLIKLSHDGTAYKTVWDKRVPASKGSKFSSIDVAADGSVYVGLNIAGASNVRVEVLKFAPDAKLLWARRYGDTIKSETNVVKVVGTQVIVGGNTFTKGTSTFADGRNGDGMLLLVNADGSLAKEHFFFTGTNPDSFDAVRDVVVQGKKLYVISDHFGKANFGEWRNPNEYGEGKLKHAWEAVAPAEYLIQDSGMIQGALTDLKDLADVKEIEAGKWTDLTANALVKPAGADVGNGYNAAVLTIIDGYLN